MCVLPGGERIVSGSDDKARAHGALTRELERVPQRAPAHHPERWNLHQRAPLTQVIALLQTIRVWDVATQQCQLVLTGARAAAAPRPYEH